jgi:hypothetical protein
MNKTTYLKIQKKAAQLKEIAMSGTSIDMLDEPFSTAVKVLNLENLDSNDAARELGLNPETIRQYRRALL